MSQATGADSDTISVVENAGNYLQTETNANVGSAIITIIDELLLRGYSADQTRNADGTFKRRMESTEVENNARWL